MQRGHINLLCVSNDAELGVPTRHYPGITARLVAFIGDENASRAPANLEWMEQRMPKRRSFKQSTSLKERLAMETTQLRKEAQRYPTGV